MYNQVVKECIHRAFSMQSQSMVEYAIYAKRARKDGFEHLASIYDIMINSKFEQAQLLYRLLNDEIPNSIENLHAVIRKINSEWKNVYAEFIEVAYDEGEEDLASAFEKICSIECSHERKILEEILLLDENTAETPVVENEDKMAKNETIKKYTCLLCGYESTRKLPVCPICIAENTFSE